MEVINLARTTNGRIGRTITRTYCDCSMLKEDGGERKTEYFTELLYGSYTVQRAQKELRRRMHNSTVNVHAVDVESGYYSMALETFLEHAELTEQD